MSTALLMLRLLLALVFVGGILWFMTRSAKAGRFGSILGGGPTHDNLEVTSQRPLGRTTSVALVRAGERHLLVGVSDHGVHLLAEGDDLAPISGDQSIGQEDRIDLDRPDGRPLQQLSTGQAAPKHLSAMFSPTQPRMTLLESLRELTVRK